MGGDTVTILTDLSEKEVMDRFRHAAGEHTGDSVPPRLREYGVEAMHLEVQGDYGFRLTFDGLRAPTRPGMEIEGRGRIVIDSSGKAKIHVGIGAKKSAVWRIGVAVTLLLTLELYNVVVLDPPDKLAYVVAIFAVAVVVMSWLQVRSLAERVWPSFLSVVNRLVVDGVDQFS